MAVSYQSRLLFLYMPSYLLIWLILWPLFAVNWKLICSAIDCCRARVRFWINLRVINVRIIIIIIYIINQRSQYRAYLQGIHSPSDVLSHRREEGTFGIRRYGFCNACNAWQHARPRAKQVANTEPANCREGENLSFALRTLTINKIETCFKNHNLLSLLHICLLLFFALLYTTPVRFYNIYIYIYIY